MTFCVEDTPCVAPFSTLMTDQYSKQEKNQIIPANHKQIITQYLRLEGNRKNTILFLVVFELSNIFFKITTLHYFCVFFTFFQGQCEQPCEEYYMRGFYEATQIFIRYNFRRFKQCIFWHFYPLLFLFWDVGI